MRSEAEMYALILGVAEKDERIRLVGMEGSRTNKNVPKDDFQDYDVSFLVTDPRPFTGDEGWLDVFGPRVIMQKPEAMALFPPELDWFSYLMIFRDGVKIDLSIIPVELLDKYLTSDRLLTVLMDKDGLVKTPPAATDCDFWIRPPSAAFVDDCCNEFWFVSTYVAKGLARNELLFASHHVEAVLRPQLFNMLKWKIGAEYGYGFSVGKSEKYIRQYLADEDWALLMETYRLDSPENCRRALLAAQQLFRRASALVCGHFGVAYPDYDKEVTAYIEKHFHL